MDGWMVHPHDQIHRQLLVDDLPHHASALPSLCSIVGERRL